MRVPHSRDKPIVSVILPVYNEATNLRRNFKKIYKTMAAFGRFEIVIAEDGSTDGSKEITKKLSNLPNVIVLSVEKRSGKGAALKTAIRAATGDIIGYVDMDLAVPLRYVEIAVRKIGEGNDVVVGSRYDGAHIKRYPARLIASKAYNLMVDIVTGSRLDDHQCGFKFWKREFIKKEAESAADNYWFFDTETLLDAQRLHKKVYVLPVSWTEHRDTKVKSSDLLYFTKALLSYAIRNWRI